MPQSQILGWTNKSQGGSNTSQLNKWTGAMFNAPHHFIVWGITMFTQIYNSLSAFYRKSVNFEIHMKLENNIMLIFVCQWFCKNASGQVSTMNEVRRCFSHFAHMTLLHSYNLKLIIMFHLCPFHLLEQGLLKDKSY